VVSLAAGLVAVALAVWLGARGDHAEYLIQWSTVRSGADPWSGGNAYGPLHNLFAIPAAWWPLLPKAAFAAMAGLASAILLRMLHANGTSTGLLGVATLLAAFLFNPLQIVATILYGQNDIVGAFFVLVAFVLRTKGRPGLAGVLIGIAALEKFYPLAFAGFLMLDGNRSLKLKVPLAALATFGLGLAVSYLVWGPTTFAPLLFGAARDPKLLSVLRFFMCYPGAVGGDGVLAFLVGNNGLFVFGVALAFLFGLWRLGAAWPAAAALGILPILVAYKVGHPQFYVAWLVPFSWLIAMGAASGAQRLARVLAPVAVYLAFVQVLYLASGAMLDEWFFLRCYISIPLLVLTIVAIASGVRVVRETPALRAAPGGRV